MHGKIRWRTYIHIRVGQRDHFGLGGGFHVGVPGGARAGLLSGMPPGVLHVGKVTDPEVLRRETGAQGNPISCSHSTGGQAWETPCWQFRANSLIKCFVLEAATRDGRRDLTLSVGERGNEAKPRLPDAILLGGGGRLRPRTGHPGLNRLFSCPASFPPSQLPPG